MNEPKTGTELLMRTYSDTRGSAAAHEQGFRTPAEAKAFAAGAAWALTEFQKAMRNPVFKND